MWIRRLLDDWPEAGDLFENDADALRQIRWHQEYLAAFRSRGSSANNHVVAEAAGRLAAACAFPWFEESARWRRDAADLLERQLAANTFPSGLNRELATDYHRFVLELALVAAVEADVAGSPLSHSDLATDGTHAGRRRGAPRRRRWGAAAGRRRRGPGARRRRSRGTRLARRPGRRGSGARPRGVVAAAAAEPRGRAARPRWRTRTRWTGSRSGGDRFADAGLVLLRTPPEDGPEIWCRCDGGPHGFLSIAAHAHADALSIEVRHDGIEILADPGTYCYHGEPAWRSLFRSTRGHNTLEVGGVDQSESGGPFLWVSQARTSTTDCRLGKASDLGWTARHDGYRRLEVPVEHVRQVALDSRRRRLTVVDSLETAGEVAVRLSWHLGPDVSVELDGARARLSWPVAGEPRTAVMTLPAELDWTVHRGELDPPLGWYSPGFGRRVPSSSLVGRGPASGASRLVTRLAFDHGQDEQDQ